MAFYYSPKIVTDGLVLYLDAANPNSYVSGSTTWIDISRGGNNGTLINGPTYSSLNEGSIVFDGVDDGLTLSSALPDLPTFTVEIVFNPSAYQYMQFTLGSVDFKWRISGQTPYWNFWTSGGSPQSTTMGVVPPINTVSSFVASYDGNNRRVGFNGNYLNSTSGTFTPRYPSSNIVGSTSFEEIYGSLYSIKVYNRALSASEVLKNYNATKSRFGLI